MCNLFNQTSAKEAMRRVFSDLPWQDLTGNLGPADIYPDRPAAIVRADGPGMALAMARWGLPSPPQFHGKSGIDRGVTNVRNLGSPHWRRWLDPAHRCLVPLDRFAEPAGGTNVWFAPRNGDPAFLAGLHVRGWTSIRKLRDGETTDDLFAFLTCPPNAEVGAVHPKAMPVILSAPDEWAQWMLAPWPEARKLQRPLADGSLVRLEGTG